MNDLDMVRAFQLDWIGAFEYSGSDSRKVVYYGVKADQMDPQARADTLEQWADRVMHEVFDHVWVAVQR